MHVVSISAICPVWIALGSFGSRLLFQIENDSSGLKRPVFNADALSADDADVLAADSQCEL